MQAVRQVTTIVRNRFRPLGIFATLAILSGCATTQSAQQIDRLESIGENPRIVLMPPDIKYYLLTAGGVPEPHAEWTEAAETNFRVAIEDYAKGIGTDLTVVDPANMGETHFQYERLHSAVGISILSHQFGMWKLPSKGNGQVFDWSLGPGISALADEHDADYGLFVFYRDYQASGGRVAFAILAAAAGVGVNTGSEGGFASLVDLHTGDVVWFNVVAAGSGELRDPEGAAAAVDQLFANIPTASQSSDSR